MILRRYHSMLTQLFFTSSHHPQSIQSIYELSLLSSDERLLIQTMNDTHVPTPPSTCIHHEFASRAMQHPQKLAVELDEQSLTYAELLSYTQVLALHLLNECDVKVGEIVCQCVERSLSMVS